MPEYAKLVKRGAVKAAPLFFGNHRLWEIRPNSPVIARTAYPVVVLYPVVKCKVVMLLVAGSS